MVLARLVVVAQESATSRTSLNGDLTSSGPLARGSTMSLQRKVSSPPGTEKNVEACLKNTFRAAVFLTTSSRSDVVATSQRDNSFN